MYAQKKCGFERVVRKWNITVEELRTIICYSFIVCLKENFI